MILKSLKRYKEFSTSKYSKFCQNSKPEKTAWRKVQEPTSKHQPDCSNRHPLHNSPAHNDALRERARGTALPEGPDGFWHGRHGCPLPPLQPRHESPRSAKVSLLESVFEGEEGKLHLATATANDRNSDCREKKWNATERSDDNGWCKLFNRFGKYIISHAGDSRVKMPYYKYLQFWTRLRIASRVKTKHFPEWMWMWGLVLPYLLICFIALLGDARGPRVTHPLNIWYFSINYLLTHFHAHVVLNLKNVNCS